MKIVAVICFLLLTIAYSSAHGFYGCGGVSCPWGSISLTKFGVCGCIEIYKCRDVSLTTRVIGTWEHDGCSYTQYDVTITNNMDANIQNIFIGTDETLKLRSYDSLWNAKRCSPDELSLPDYQPSINAHASYTFGFILRGTVPANLAILSVVY
ncbi:hypothetical protein DICPUDRAFT_50740 [Dictyostelium purpureum]|uniref:Carbohydrate binding domain-containing protein n=1 Tax=Dictyostelium purpureum TaxID=5786 RepID=F1A039_DICPU|nr:uncharacterized protein DICPUDRAFT_50740 [Dictyostelium purpureum]EGC30437.1 hypothetical protein DICPUDRAFT_50740 [Dictyostelium purpureum]|eukprot:XP_003293037.1 hypothetical protein DICPUDRAFT_50740 [Dictyostelium purpureum]